MTRELLSVCEAVVPNKRPTLSMSKNYPKLYRLLPSELIIPLQESLIVNLPPAGSSARDYEPFPVDPPKFQSMYMI